MLFFGVAACGNSDGTDRKPVVVYAAASLTDALEAMADSFEIAYPDTRVVYSIAATSLLARQLEQGARADLFFSANLAWMRFLEEKGRTEGPVLEPLGNRLVVAGRRDAAFIDNPEALLQVDRLALADPEGVPAGLYARAGLECLGLWEQLSPRIVPTLDVRAALLAVQHGAAELAIVYASDMMVVPELQVVMAWPETCQPEIRYAVARLRKAPNPEGADRFLSFLTDPKRDAQWLRFGFLPHPNDE